MNGLHELKRGIAVHTRMRHWLLVSLAIILVSVTPLARAERGTAPQSISGLGTLTFPTSAHSDAAQAAFVRGVLLLHVFEYRTAAEAFRQAERLDPGFAMAYWGEAMTYNHSIWNQLDADAGRAALMKLGPTPAARAARAPTAREKAYLAAVEILYSGKGSKQERDERYCMAMQRLAAAYPKDNNAQLFYALALMGSHEGVRDLPDYLHAAAIAKRIFRLNPRNPGAAHYWIHGMDDPQHAAGALEAARALSKIAPDAGHAQHMTSHIFMALGMWDDVVTANVNALRVVNAQARAAGRPEVACGHYPLWLEYGYFQQGRRQQAEKVLEGCAQSVAAARNRAVHAGHSTSPMIMMPYDGSLANMRGVAVVESRDWNGKAARLDVATTGLGPYAAWNDFTTGYAAAERRDLKLAKQALASVHHLRATNRKDPGDPQVVGYLAVLDDELRGMVLIREGHADTGLASIRHAASRYDAMAFDFGPPAPLKPPHELLGEAFLQAGRAKEAAAQFGMVFKEAPNRCLALLGLARAQAILHQTTAAVAAYQKLLANWHAADPDTPALAEARQYVVAHK
jgi:tetratricopeptide (TPR) repeat protein